MPRPSVVLAATLCSALTGCMGWAYPNVAYCPAAAVGPAAGEVRAVAVDVEQRFYQGKGCKHFETHTLREADPAAGARYRPFVSHGHCVGPFGEHVSRYLLTKLYRPGYRTVTVERGRTPGEWVPAASAGDQEAAVLDLVYRSRTRQPDDPELYLKDGRPGLSPGSADPGHKAVLLFAAGECDRVAGLYADGTAGAARMRAETAALRRRAAE